MSVPEFRAALEAEIRRAAVEERKYSIERTKVEELGKSVGLSEAAAARIFLDLAGDVWVGSIMPAEGREFRLHARPPRGRIEPNWLAAFFDMQWMWCIESRGFTTRGAL